MAISVAIAAPFIPISSTKMKNGASTRLTPAPMNMEFMALRGYPEARMRLLKLKPMFITSMPGRR